METCNGYDITAEEAQRKEMFGYICSNKCTNECSPNKGKYKTCGCKTSEKEGKVDSITVNSITYENVNVCGNCDTWKNKSGGTGYNDSSDKTSKGYTCTDQCPFDATRYNCTCSGTEKDGKCLSACEMKGLYDTRAACEKNMDSNKYECVPSGSCFNKQLKACDDGYTRVDGECVKEEACSIGYKNIGKTSQSCNFNYDSDQYALSNGDNCFKRCYCPDKAYENNPEDDTLTMSINYNPNWERGSCYNGYGPCMNILSPVLKFGGGKKMKIYGKVKFRLFGGYTEQDFNCDMSSGKECEVPVHERGMQINFRTYFRNEGIVKSMDITLHHLDMPNYKIVLKYDGGYYFPLDQAHIHEAISYGCTYKEIDGVEIIDNCASITFNFNIGANDDLKWHAYTYFNDELIGDYDVSWYKRKSTDSLGTYYFKNFNTIDGIPYQRDTDVKKPYILTTTRLYNGHAFSSRPYTIRIPIGLCGGKSISLRMSATDESFPLKKDILNDMEETDENCEFPGQGGGSTSSGGHGSFGGGSGSSKCYWVSPSSSFAGSGSHGGQSNRQELY